MNPILIVALTLFAVSLPVLAFIVMHTRRINRLHTLALAEQQRLAGEVLDATHREHRREYAALHRETHDRIEQQRASNQRLVKHNQRLMYDLADARIQAIPLHEEPFTEADRRTLLDALVKLTAARTFYASLNSAEAGNILRIEHALMAVVERLSRHLVADGTLQLRAWGQIERDAKGWWSHPYLPLFSEGLTRERQDAWLKAQHLEARLLWDERFEEHPAPDFSDDISSFEPKPPEGDGWFLLTIEQNEDGEARAWYARRVAAEPAAAAEAAA
ncbi:hypothetical protein [Pseudomonas oryzihabitans]|uniref:hypothetical protein n=1 Tax=Pseudomonas oryzihabitans TaxID=47885 RepID=UPI002893A9F0|nr:hypothetical protein [Pseudomonas oryzihabitans]MDT3720321.1 hypothetical protein [Pseudomonas oryzihabitans]